jgi:hypothetical protein
MPDATDNVYEFLSFVAKDRGYVTKKRNPAGMQFRVQFLGYKILF